MGAVLFEAATGEKPFRSDAGGRAFEQVPRRARVPAASGVPVELRRVVDGRLDPDPERRPPVGDVQAELEAFAARR